MKKPQIRNRDELLRRLHHALDAGDLSDPVIGDVLSNRLLLRIADEVETRRENNDWYVPTGKPRGVAPHKGDIVRAFAKDHPAWSQRENASHFKLTPQTISRHLNKYKTK